MPGIYVHVPFCAAKCGYCDFHSIVADGSFVGNYIRAFQQEAAYYGRKYQNQVFETLFFGGGTPTVLEPKQLSQMIEVVLENFNFNSGFEFTIEANPCTLGQEKVDHLAILGVNRISLGVQTFQDNLLKRLERLHSTADIYTSVEYLRKAGINNFNLDLMYGLPEQSLRDWETSLDAAIALQPTHLSCYSLILEEDTPFFEQYNQGLLNLPSEDLEYEMFELVKNKLRQAGYQHYEVSNYALKEEYQAKHNLIYWHNQPYLGLGSGAHSYMEQSRYVNSLDLNRYIENWLDNQPAIDHIELISEDQAMDETMMLGLRLLDGVEEAVFAKRFGQTIMEVYAEEIEELLAKKLVIWENGRLKLTDRGLSLGNHVFSAFIR